MASPDAIRDKIVENRIAQIAAVSGIVDCKYRALFPQDEEERLPPSAFPFANYVEDRYDGESGSVLITATLEIDFEMFGLQSAGEYALKNLRNDAEKALMNRANWGVSVSGGIERGWISFASSGPHPDITGLDREAFTFTCIYKHTHADPGVRV